MLLKKTIVALLLCFTSFFVIAQRSEAVLQYIEKYKAIAIKEMQRTGVPASITLAQGIFESNAGQSNLVTRSQNHFGIKCKTDWKGEKVYHDDDARGECFRSYSSAEESFIDHSDFLKTRAHYAFLFTLDPEDYKAWAKGLKKAGYATNPAYPEKLIKLIENYDLQQYTLIALNKDEAKKEEIFTYAKTDVPATKSAETKVEAIPAADTNAASVSEEKKEVASVSTAIDKAEDEIEDESHKYPSGVFYVNNVKALYVKKGTSLLALANQHNISYPRVFEFNEIKNKMDILPEGQVIYLSKKPKKSNKDFCTASGSETIEQIAHREAVALDALLQYNKLKEGDKPAAGEKIYLKKISPSKPKLAAS